MAHDQDYDIWSPKTQMECRQSICYLEKEISFLHQQYDEKCLSEQEQLDTRKICKSMTDTIATLEDRLADQSADATLSREEIQQLRNLFWSVQRKLDSYSYQHTQNAYQIEDVRQKICNLNTKFHGSQTRLEERILSFVAAALEAQESDAKQYMDAQLEIYEQRTREELKTLSMLVAQGQKFMRSAKFRSEQLSRELFSLSDELERAEAKNEDLNRRASQWGSQNSFGEDHLKRRSYSSPKKSEDIARVRQPDKSWVTAHSAMLARADIVDGQHSLFRFPSRLDRDIHYKRPLGTSQATNHTVAQMDRPKAKSIESHFRCLVNNTPRFYESPHQQLSYENTQGVDTYAVDSSNTAPVEQRPRVSKVWRCRAPKVLHHECQCPQSWRKK